MSKLALAKLGARVETRPDGAILLHSDTPLNAHSPRIFDPVLAWADKATDRVALADRRGAPGEWRTLTYGGFADQTARIAQALLDLGAGPDRPVVVISDNRIEAAVVAFAAYRAGVPVAPLTPAYSANGADPSRLASIFETLRPGVVVAESLALHGAALAAQVPPGTPIVSLSPEPGLTFSTLLETSPGAALAAAERAVEADTIAKILFTSGSTGTPKGALTTHRMLASNCQAVMQSWPFLADEPPTISDWLPWNHVFGGSFVLNTMLATGGTFYIDDGRPMPGLIRKSAANGAEVQPTIHLNAPRGLDLIGRVLADEPDLARRFFSRLGLVFFASAGLPPRIRADWMRLIDQYATRPVAFCSAWGTTETAPLATVLNFDAEQINNIGAPAPGTTVKLAPVSGRYELRVKGPNVTPGYLARADHTAAAFDEEGFFRTGDSGRLADPQDASAGVLIEGRLAEDFKLSSGVWVNVSGLRGQLLESVGPTVRDVVLSGPNRDEIVALVFLDVEQCERLAGEAGDCAAMAAHARVLEHIGGVIARHNDTNRTSSRAIARFRLMDRNLDPSAGELTDKGTVNQAAVLRREAALCDALHSAPVAPA